MGFVIARNGMPPRLDDEPGPPPPRPPPPSHAFFNAVQAATSVTGIANTALRHNPTSSGVQCGTHQASSHTDKYSWMSGASIAATTAEHAANVALSAGPSSTATAPADDDRNPDRISSFRQAAPLPKFDERAVERTKQKLLANIGRFAGHGETGIDLYFQQVHEEALLPKDRENPSTKKGRRALLVNWNSYALRFCKKVSVADHWSTKFVREFARTFLRLRVQWTKGRDGAPHVRATTVGSWLTALLHCILKYCRDRETNEATGMKLLVLEDFFHTLNNEVNQLVDDFGLERTRMPVLFFGHAEVRLMNQVALTTSLRNGRIAKLQSMLGMLLIFQTGLRTSSLAAPYAEFRDKGRYLKLKHIKILRIGSMRFQARFHITEWKAQSEGPKGKEENFVLETVTKSHNLSFDVVLVLIAFLWARGAFGDISIADIYKSKATDLKIIETMRDQPLFLKATYGGHELTDEPTLGIKISEAIRALSVSAGLPSGGAATLRRDFANFLGILLGKAIAAQAIGHQDQSTGVYSTHYSRNLANIPLSAIRTFELEIEDPLAKTTFAMHELMRVAVTALLFKDIDVEKAAQAEDTDEEKPRPAVKNTKATKKNLDKDDRESIENHPDMKAIQRQIQHEWSTFIACFEPSPTKYAMTKGNITTIFKKSEKFRVVNTEQANKQRAIFDGLFDRITRKRRALTKTANRAKQHDRSSRMVEGLGEEDTYERRQEMMARADAPSSIIAETSKAGASAFPLPKPAAAPTAQPTEPAFSGPSDALPESEIRLYPMTPSTLNPDDWISWSDSVPAAEYAEEEPEDEIETTATSATLWNSLNPLFRTKYTRPVQPSTSSAPKPASDSNKKDPVSDSDWLVDDEAPGTRFAEAGYDAGETEMLNVPIDQLAFYYLCGLVQPIIEERERKRDLKAAVTDDGSTLVCPKDGCPFTVSTRSRSNFERHLAIGHSRWRQFTASLLVQKRANKRQRSVFRCPVDRTVFHDKDEIIAHCLSKECASHIAHNDMHDEYLVARERWPAYAQGKGFRNFVDPSELEDEAAAADQPEIMETLTTDPPLEFDDPNSVRAVAQQLRHLGMDAVEEQAQNRSIVFPSMSDRAFLLDRYDAVAEADLAALMSMDMGEVERNFEAITAEDSDGEEGAEDSEMATET